MKSLKWQSERKNGGGSSIICLLYLCMISLLCSVVYTNGKTKAVISELTDTYRKGHFLWLEALYYARNEINDESFWKWEESGENYSVNVSFDKKNKQVRIMTSYEDLIHDKIFSYDLDCRCIFEVESMEE